MENTDDIGACLNFNFKAFFPRRCLFAGFGKVNMFSTPKNVYNERTDSGFFCSDNFV